MIDRPTIDLNADLGEGFPWDDALLERVTSASLSCGAHAGDRRTIERTLRLAAGRGVSIGAHPGYPDREGFGRRERDDAPDILRELIVGQVESLRAIAAGIGVTLRYVKPHGALYNQAQRDPRVASAVVSAVEPLRLPLVGMPGTVLERLASEAGLRFVREGFADRRYDDEGGLLPRTRAGAVLDDPGEIEAQVMRLIGGHVETICLHGDHPRSLDLASALRDFLRHRDIDVRSFLDP